MKPILIDALHINMGGAYMILNHLIDRLVAKGVNFVLLKDSRCPILNNEDKIPVVVTLSASSKVRRSYYKSHKNVFRAVLDLGNIPPLVKMPCQVYTYIHNVSLLKTPADYPLTWKIKAMLKRIYIWFYSRNTDAWVVQTSNTANMVRHALPCSGKQLLIYPFYMIPDALRIPVLNERNDYCFIGEYTNAKGHEYLIEAWRLLAKKRINCVLHLTVSSNIPKLLIEQAKKDGAVICNHGYVSFDEVARIYKQCKAIVYPSLNESLGLGLIEAIEAGCDVIGCNLQYLYSVCEPSATFKERSAESIVDAVLDYETGKCQKTKLKIHDMADELIDLLNNSTVTN